MKIFQSIFLLFLVSQLYADNISALLFQGNCTACHHKVVNKSAPSMMQVRQNYLKAFPRKKEFVQYMSQWVKNPTSEHSIMHNAIQKYKLMPELAFDKETLKEISSYIYDTNFTKVSKKTQ
ncbi:cytochrome C [Sulfurimonas sp.]